MGSIHRPKRGSRAFSPRVRSKSHIPKFRSWPDAAGEPKLQAFAGYKAGMTHVVMIDDVKNSVTEGAEISVPVTIIETPAIRVAAIRVYKDTTYGLKAVAESWTTDLEAELAKRLPIPKTDKMEETLGEIAALIDAGKIADVRVLTYTLPKAVKAIPKKVPDIMETGISGSDIKAKFEYAKSILGSSLKFSDLFSNGAFVDTAAITIGKGTQGAVKRWGISLMKGKHSRQGSRRQIGTLGPWRPERVMWGTPLMGQTGYHQRTEVNKRILKIGEDGSEVTPKGGFINYGEVSGEYVLIKGSVPGPSKRLIRIRDPVRAKGKTAGEPNVLYISTQSKQG